MLIPHNCDLSYAASNSLTSGKKTDIPRKGYKERSCIHRTIITPRIAGAPLHLRIDSGRTTPARPSARAPGSRAAHIASAPAVHASGNRGSHQSSATRAAQQVPTASSSSAPQNRTRSPVSSARPLCPSHGPSRAAASHLHSELRHALHTAHTRPPETSTAPAPPLPTRCTLPQHSTRAYGV